MAPCPTGVSGTNALHYLYVSGGSGTAEAVQITGGTCTSGASSGTLTFTPANNHTGAWTIQSATTGIEEALQVIGSNGGTVNIPPGLHMIYGPISVTQEGAHIRCMTRNNATSMIQRNTGKIFDVQAGSVEIGGCALRGGQYIDTVPHAAPAGNIGIVSTGVRGHFHDLMIDLLYGGIQLTGGFHTKITNIWGRNVAGYVIKHSGGVSPFIDTVEYATDSPYEVPSEAGIVINASGAYVYNTDILIARNGILIEPVTEDVTWTFIYDARFDQNFHAGVTIRNASIYSLQGVFIHDLWSATAGVGAIDSPGFTSGGAHPGSEDGIGVIIGEGGAGRITDVVIDGGEIFNNRWQNIKIFDGASRISLKNLKLYEANLGNGVAGSIDTVYVATTGHVEISECEIRGAAAGKGAMRSGILGAPVALDLLFWNNTFDASAVWTSEPTHDLSTNGGMKNRGFNNNLDDVAQSVTAASTLALGARQYFDVLGTTTIDNLAPSYQGRKVVLHNPDAGAFATSTAGNIQNALTINQNESAVCVFYGSKWICQK
jgi:hypothetical protein